MHNEHTIMTKLAKLRVHIVPLGFEIDRILLPIQKTDKCICRCRNFKIPKSKFFILF